MPIPSDAVKPSWPKAAVVAFGRFWWDFLVGDTPELTVAVGILVALVALLAATVSETLAWILLPILVLASLVASTLRGRRKR